MSIRPAFAVACLMLALGGAALAQTYTIGGLTIERPWTRATPGGAKVGAGYLTIVNRGTVADRLAGGSIAVADGFELHATTTEAGVARMRPAAAGIEIKPGETVELKPEGLHVMFTGLRQPIVAGERIKARLVFEKAGTIEVEFAAEGLGGARAPGGHAAPAH
jgi:copper(I)-binding protein